MARLEALRLPRRRARTPRGWQRLRWALLGIVTVIVTIVASLPAAWMADRVAAETQRRVLLADAAGTMWQGSATLALSAGAGSQTATVLPGRLSWNVAFWPLLGGTLRVVLEQDATMAAPVTVSVSPAGWTVQPGSMRLPASLLEGVGAPFNTRCVAKSRAPIASCSCSNEMRSCSRCADTSKFSSSAISSGAKGAVRVAIARNSKHANLKAIA